MHFSFLSAQNVECLVTLVITDHHLSTPRGLPLRDDACETPASVSSTHRQPVQTLNTLNHNQMQLPRKQTLRVMVFLGSL